MVFHLVTFKGLLHVLRVAGAYDEFEAVSWLEVV